MGADAGVVMMPRSPLLRGCPIDRSHPETNQSIAHQQVAELKEALDAVGLPKSGLKAELMERLLGHIAAAAGGGAGAAGAGDAAAEVRALRAFVRKCACPCDMVNRLAETLLRLGSC